MAQILDNMLHNPNNQRHKSYFYHCFAIFYAIEERYGLAALSAKQALALKESLQLRRMLIKWLISDNQFDQAITALQTFRAKMNPLKVPLYEKELKWLEVEIKMGQHLYEL